MSQVWYTADPHFGHQKVAQQRGFTSSEEMDAQICSSWHRQVADADEVYVLGDIAARGHRQALATLAGLPGHKHLVMGNHDEIHPMNRTTFSRAAMLAWLDVFETVATFRRLNLDGEELLLCHFPYAAWGDGALRDGSRYDQYRLPDLGTPLLHGHTHGSERAHGHSFHVGWDAWHELVPEETVLDWLTGTDLREIPSQVA